MCGIAGIIDCSSAQRSELIEIANRMCKVLRHRGPDDSGVWVNEEDGVAISHRRLSIIDLSNAGKQPMKSECGRFILTFNGEIYNHRSIRKEINNISDYKYSWKGHSDTETVVAGISLWGIEKTLKKLQGMFALGVWDKVEKTMTLARDRAGEKPIYYAYSNKELIFGSELKAIRFSKRLSWDLDLDAVDLYIRNNYIPAPQTIYKGVKKLEPGKYIQFKLNRDCIYQSRIEDYWSLADIALEGMENSFNDSYEENIKSLDSLINASVKSQMLADVPIGSLLSGGIDSTLITAIMQKNCDYKVNTFTLGFEDSIYDESRHSKKIARYIGTEHHELIINSQDIITRLTELPQIYDEPFADSSQLPTLMVMELASKNVKVALTGDGGDEFFGGYNRYLRAPQTWNYISMIPTFGRTIIGNNLQRLSNKRMKILGKKIQLSNNLEQWSSLMTQEWIESEQVILGIDSPLLSFQVKKNTDSILDATSKMLLQDGTQYLPDDILVKVDRASMSKSLETRCPLLDQRVMEFAWKLPLKQKIGKGKGKLILKELLYNYIPKELVEKPKKGFAIPIDEWLRGPLRDWAEAQVSEERLSFEGYFKKDLIRKTWESHLEGSANNGSRLWSILMFQSWLESTRK